MTKLFKTTFYLLFSILLISACGDEEPSMMEEEQEEEEMMDECAGVETSYKDDIAPILQNSCAISGCHVAGFSRGDWSEYDNVKDNAEAIKNRATIQKNMPPASSTGPVPTDEERMLIKCWIEAGAMDN